MSLESISNNPDQLGDILDRTGPVTADATHAIYDEAAHLFSCANDYIRKNPVPVVLGAAAFGIAIGYLIVANRREDTFQERYVNEPLENASDALSSSFARLYDNLKFW